MLNGPSNTLNHFVKGKSIRGIPSMFLPQLSGVHLHTTELHPVQISTCTHGLHGGKTSRFAILIVYFTLYFINVSHRFFQRSMSLLLSLPGFLAAICSACVVALYNFCFPTSFLDYFICLFICSPGFVHLRCVFCFFYCCCLTLSHSTEQHGITQ